MQFNILSLIRSPLCPVVICLQLTKLYATKQLLNLFNLKHRLQNKHNG